MGAYRARVPRTRPPRRGGPRGGGFERLRPIQALDVALGTSPLNTLEVSAL